ncbi:MAG: nucleotidyltransferase domain-containing protein [Deltaproteobacteria bacterium]|nr:nucleotidyltransferase domain-containing protein [Deltaproteobacteria bacterium]
MPEGVGREAEIMREAIAILVRECAPARIYLFGSRAKKTAKKGADFDFAVEGPVPSDARRRIVKDLLESVAGLYSVNLVFLSEVDEKFRSIILESGALVYEQKGN